MDAGRGTLEGRNGRCNGASGGCDWGKKQAWGILPLALGWCQGEFCTWERMVCCLYVCGLHCLVLPSDDAVMSNHEGCRIYVTACAFIRITVGRTSGRWTGQRGREEPCHGVGTRVP